MEETPKILKLLLDYSDADGIRSKKEMSVKINAANLVDKTVNIWIGSKLTYTLSFSLKIPDHIHSFIIGKTVPLFGISRKSETKNYPNDFAKTITCQNIGQLTEQWWTIIIDYEWLKKNIAKKLIKVIFYKFDNKSSEWKSSYNGIDLGKTNKLNYNYSIGYITDNGVEQHRYNCDKKLICKTNEKEFYQLKYSKWTPEKQIFFEDFQQSFETLIKRLSEFGVGEGLTDERINELIANKTYLLLS